jgi:hypothetical protein
VSHDHDLLVRVTLNDPLYGLAHSLKELGSLLTAGEGERKVHLVRPAFVEVGEAFPKFIQSNAAYLTKVHLFQSVMGHSSEVQSLSNALGRLPGPLQRAGVKGGDGLLGLGQPTGDEGRFPLALLIQRYPIPPLPATVKVAIGLAVADQE